MDYFKLKYGVCYQQDPFNWICNCNYNSWKEADSNSVGLKGQTRLVTVNNAWPQFIKKMILREQLKPNIHFEEPDE